MLSQRPVPSTGFEREDLQALGQLLERVVGNNCQLDGTSVVGSHVDGGPPPMRSPADVAKMGHPFVCLRAMEAQITVVNSLQQSLTDIFTHYRTVWCSMAQCGIYKLPNEILSNIFKLSLHEESDQYLQTTRKRHSRLKAALAIAHVSRKFREVANNTLSLWNTLYAQLRSGARDKLLERTKDAPLNIQLGPRFFEQPNKGFLQTMLRHAARWQQLRLTYGAAKDAETFMKALHKAKPSFVQLNYFSVLSQPSGTDEGSINSTLDIFQYLTENKGLPSPGPSTSPYPVDTLTTCNICLSHSGLQLHNTIWLISKLSLFKALKTLTIALSDYRPVDGPVSVPPAATVHEFPNLRSLYIDLYRNAAQKGLAGFIGAICAPRLHRLALAIDVPPRPGTWLEDTASAIHSANGTLNEMRILEVQCKPDSLVFNPTQGPIPCQPFPPTLLRLMPLLESLSITGDTLKPPFLDEISSSKDDDLLDLDLPRSLTSVSFVSIPQLTPSYVSNLISLLKKRSNWDSFDVLRIHDCSKIGEKDAKELAPRVGEERFQWTPAQRMSLFSSLQPALQAAAGAGPAGPVEMDMNAGGNMLGFEVDFNLGPILNFALPLPLGMPIQGPGPGPGAAPPHAQAPPDEEE